MNRVAAQWAWRFEISYFAFRTLSIMQMIVLYKIIELETLVNTPSEPAE
jgi:hypothetical protein